MKEFLTTEFSAENLEFWLAIKKFKQLTEQKDIEDKARNIFQTYFRMGSKKELNISEAQLRRLERSLQVNSKGILSAQLIPSDLDTTTFKSDSGGSSPIDIPNKKEQKEPQSRSPSSYPGTPGSPTSSVAPVDTALFDDVQRSVYLTYNDSVRIHSGAYFL
jgi:hypothetical protein